MRDIKKVSFDLEVITPMFLSGADGKTAELRPASIKGLLRYWWRAIQAEPDWKELRKRESKIFGASDEKVGGSSFSIRVAYDGILRPKKNKFPDNLRYKVPIEGKTFQINILEYLAYGTYEYERGVGNVFKREYYPPDTKFKLIFNFLDETWKDEILRVMYVLNLFGGMGSRSRNGFGSINILNKNEVFRDLADRFSIDKAYEEKNLKKLIKSARITDYSAFSQGTKVFRAKSFFDEVFDSLANVGKIYRNARGSLERRHHFDKRQYIGTPLEPPKENFKSFIDRHAKPYFIKIAKEYDKYRAYILYLPSRYCIGLEKDRNNNRIDHMAVDNEFNRVCGEFNRLLSQNMDTLI